MFRVMCKADLLRSEARLVRSGVKAGVEEPFLTGGERMHIPGSDGSEMRDSRRGFTGVGVAGGSIGRECCAAHSNLCHIRSSAT
jgi:hypothetical protein